MGKVITICNNKGGTSKSTTAHTLAVGLHLKGLRVLLIDSDPQCNLSQVSNINTMENFNTIYELMKEERKIEDVIVRTDNYDIIPGSMSIARADSEFTQPPYVANCYYLLKEQIDKVKDAYDYIIIDTPPTLTLITQNCLVASDSVIIPTQADMFCLNGLANIKKQIDVITQRTTNKGLYIEGILITKFNDRTNLNKLLKEKLFEMANMLNTKIYQFAVRESVEVREAQTLKTNILLINPNNNSAVDYGHFIEEFLNDNKKKEVK